MKPDRIESSGINTQGFVNVWDVDLAQGVITPKEGFTLDVSGVSSIDWADITGLTPANGDTLQYIAGAWANRTATQVKATLGLTVGTDVQAYDADLAAIAALTPNNDDVIQRKAGAWANRTIAQLLTDLGLGALYQPLDSGLTAIAALSTTAYGRSLLAAADAAALRVLAGAVIGTNVQAYDAELAALAGLVSAANKIPMFSGSGTATLLTLDTDGTLAANSATNVPSQSAVKTYVDTAVTGLLEFKGSTDCSGNPNYPAANKGDAYVVSVAGKIGGASGTSVDVGDVYLAIADNAGGTQAGVGTSWTVLEHNLLGALLSANNLSDVANASTARTNLGLAIDTNVQAYAVELAALAVLTSAADSFPYFTGSGTAALLVIVSAIRTVLASTTLALFRSNAGLAIGTDVQAWDADLDSIAALAKTKGNLIAASGSVWNALAVGTDGQQIIGDSNSTNGVKWVDQPLNSLSVYITNRYYSFPFSGAVLTQSLTVNTAYFLPIIIKKRSVWIGIAFDCHTFNNDMKMALFDNSNSGKPGVVVTGTTGTFTTGVNGICNIVFGAAVTLDAGVYFISCMASSGSGSVNCIPDFGGGQEVWGRSSGDTSGVSVAARSTTYTYAGGFSSSNPTLAYTDATWNPIMLLRAQ